MHVGPALQETQLVWKQVAKNSNNCSAARSLHNSKSNPVMFAGVCGTARNNSDSRWGTALNASLHRLNELNRACKCEWGIECSMCFISVSVWI